MRRLQPRRLQDRRTERLLRRHHTHEAAEPQVADDLGGVMPIRGGAPRPADARPPVVTSWVAAIGDAA